MAKKRGLDCYFYIASAVLATVDSSAIGSATWNLIGETRSVDGGVSASEIDGTSRASNGWTETFVGLKSGSGDIEVVYNAGDTDISALETAWDNGTALGFAFMDGPIATTGSHGRAGNFVITGLSQSEPIDGIVTLKLTIKNQGKVISYTKS